MTDYQTARASLGARLREVRGESGLSGRALAQELGWHPSKVSKLELGRQTASVDDLKAWAGACGAADAAPELIAMRRTLETHYASWRRQLAGGTRAEQAAFVDLESRTYRLRAFESAVVPGILQTPEYARHLLQAVVDLHGAPDDIEAGVGARMERARILSDPLTKLDIVMWEPVLYARLCPREVMIAQLEYITHLIAGRRVAIGVVPLRSRLPAVPEHGFWIFDDDRVNVETTGAELTLTDGDSIAPYRRVFAELSAVAVRGTAALRLVERARYGLGSESGA